ncbi:MAG: MMPL family transporter [Treponema sp.]|jgi:predicted RND superfamily exporter protein|nr:MMPL family transporter [Treponema sp.]
MNKDFLDRIFRHPRLIVLVIAMITVFFAFQLPSAELDNNNIRFIPDNDEALQTSRYIDETFGSSVFMLIGLERKYGDVFDAKFLNKIREFNARLEDFEIVGEVNSLVSSDYIYAEGDTIVVQKIAGGDFSGTREEIAGLKQKILSWDIYRRALVSDDFSATQILVPLKLTDEQMSRPEVIDDFIEIRDLAKVMFAGYAEVYVTGIPIISATINEAMSADLATMIPLVAIVVLLVLFFSFRRFTPVMLPLITVLVAAVWSMGAMPLLGVKLSVISTVLPVILVAVGSAYGIHIVTHYVVGTDNAEMSREEHFAFVLSIIRKIGKAVFLAALTTLAGFSSLCFTTVPPIREFGFFSSFGVLVSFLIAVTLIPSLLIIRGPSRDLRITKTDEGPPAAETSRSDFAVASFFAEIARKRKAVIFVVIVIVGFSVWGITKVVIDNIFVEYFLASTDIARSDRFIREKFGGSKIVSVVVEADNSESLLMPEVLIAMDDLGTYLEDHVSEVGKVMGFTDLVKRINQVFNAGESPEGLKPSGVGNDSFGFSDFGFADFGFDDFGFGFSSFDDNAPGDTGYTQSGDGQENIGGSVSANDIVALLRRAASSGKSRSIDVESFVREMEKLVNYEGAAYYEIPGDPARYGKTTPEELSLLVSNYLILLSGNISSYANDPLSPTAIKTTVQLRTLGDNDSSAAIAGIRRYIAENFPPGIRTIVGGVALVESSLNRLVVESQISSVFVSILVVFLIVALSNRSVVAGIVGIAPLSICILINFAVMGFAGIKLNIGTSMVASVSVGIGIDYTIHYIEAYKREYLAAGGKGDYLLKTFASSGKAILINAASVGAGFAVLLLSNFVMLKHLGLLIAITMASSALVSLTVIPVLLLTLKPKFIHMS